MTNLPAGRTAKTPKCGGRVPRSVLAFTLLLAGALVPVAGSEPRGWETARLVPAPTEPLKGYRGIRRVHVVSERFRQEAWLDAWTELSEAGFAYQILSERGSEQIRNRVLRPMLQREQELVADGSDRAALTDANYVFTELEEAGGELAVLIKPRRKDVVLVDGRVVLTPDGSDVARIEGRLAKTPSFWTSRVDVRRHFVTIDGVRVTVSTETLARVRLAGESRMQVAYEYESINGHPVSAAGRQLLARAAVR